jgi:diacylglycerol O-acyltransferase / wax synthase
VTIDRLSPLDASFLQVESPTAHMHVGWAARFAPPARGAVPSFEDIRSHIAGRLARAPRYRQKLASVPLGVGDPVWIDAAGFDIAEHVRRARSSEFSRTVDAVMSTPLDHDRPLWELWVADRLEDGGLGVVGKAHHCMVDGLAAVELAGLLLDPTTDPPPAEPDGWRPESPPDGLGLAAQAVLGKAGALLGLVGTSARVAFSPQRLLDGLPRSTEMTRALAQALRPAPTDPAINQPISPSRHLALIRRPLAELVRVKQHFGATVNDVLLASSSGGLRQFQESRGETPGALKTMVPVSLRDGENLGNQISFVFVDLPCDEPDPVRRLQDVHAEMNARKRDRAAAGADQVMKAVELAPRTLRARVSRLVASPRAFNLTVSNIPGPREPLYMLGCELEEAYPVVPIADGHALSIGMTTVKDTACFGVYADSESVPEADVIAAGIEETLDELLARSR